LRLGIASKLALLSLAASVPTHLCRGKPRQKCSGRPGRSRPGCRRRLCQSSFQGIKTFALAALPRCQPQTAPGAQCQAFGHQRLTFVPADGPSRPRPRRPSVQPFCRRSLSGSGSLRSPSPCTAKARRPPHLPDRLRGHAPLRSAPYGTVRLTEAPQGHRQNLSICETASTIGPPETPASAASRMEPTSPARKDGTRDKYIHQEAAADAAMGSVVIATYCFYIVPGAG
jgi:hypothetical protein